MIDVVMITESDYLAIIRWDDDGGAARDVIYQLVTDPTFDPPCAATPEPQENGNPKQSGAIPLA